MSKDTIAALDNTPFELQKLSEDGDVRVRFGVANPHRSEDDLNGGGLAITKIEWRE